MKRTLLTIIMLAILLPYTAKAQSMLKIMVIDSATNLPLSHVGLKIENTGYGSVTDSNGISVFDLSLIKKDTLCVALFLYQHPDKRICLSKEEAEVNDFTLTIPISLHKPTKHKGCKPKKRKRRMMNDLPPS